jgi:hypothetical protein
LKEGTPSTGSNTSLNSNKSHSKSPSNDIDKRSPSPKEFTKEQSPPAQEEVDNKLLTVSSKLLPSSPLTRSHSRSPFNDTDKRSQSPKKIVHTRVTLGGGRN